MMKIQLANPDTNTLWSLLSPFCPKKMEVQQSKQCKNDKDSKKMPSNSKKKPHLPYVVTLGIRNGKRRGQGEKAYLQPELLSITQRLSFGWLRLTPMLSKKPSNQRKPIGVERSWQWRDMVPCTIPGLQGTLDSYHRGYGGRNYPHSSAGPHRKKH